MEITSQATQHDLTRPVIVERFRERLSKNERTRLTRDERETLALILVDTLIELNQRREDTKEAIERVCRAEQSLLEEGFPKSSINSTYLPLYTRLLNKAIEAGKITLTERNSYPKEWTKRDGSESGVSQRHYGFDYLTYDLATQSELRGTTTASNNKRQDDLKPVAVHEYLMQVKELLGSNDAELLTIAIAALTGRRHTEIVSVGRFTQTVHPYLIQFEGQQKKKEAESYEILCLIEAKELLPVIERYRALPEMQGLVGLDDEAPEIERFNSRVNRRVQSFFGETGLVPVLEGFKTVSIHRLRALYGAIAIYFFCANNQHVHRFLQNHLGHVLDREITAANSRATDHYFHYYLTKEDGTPLTARGVKLMGVEKLPEPALPDDESTVNEIISIPETRDAGRKEEKEKSKPAQRKVVKRGSLRIDGGEHDRWAAVLSVIAPLGKSQHEKMTDLLRWIESRLGKPAETDATITAQAKTLAWLTQEVEALRAEVAALQARDNQVDATALQQELAALRAENAGLKQAKAQLDSLRKMLGASEPEKAKLPLQQVSNAPVVSPAPIQSQQSTTATKGGGTSGSGAAIERANRIFEAVKAWNTQFPERSFAISSGLLEHSFNINRAAAKQFTENNPELSNYHQSVGIHKVNSHNRQIGRNLDELKNFVHSSLQNPPVSG